MKTHTPGSEFEESTLGTLELIQQGEVVPSTIHPDLSEAENILSIERFNLWYGESQALYDVSMGIPKGQITSLVGPSGCGKSTLLRSVNRLNDLLDFVTTTGDMKLSGRSIYKRGVDVIELRKRMGMVFQKPNPFPMSIFENVVYPLRIDGVRDKSLLSETCEMALRGAALWDEVKDRLKDNALGMSGGQQQRLCIARAIASQPEVLLLDEPCSALDPVATRKIEELLQQLRGDYSILMVTHNMQQAQRCSDNTAFMYLGQLVEYGPTLSLFSNPALKETESYISGRFG
ncbi:MAG: phosphate ABC transporter ATP-binding protein [Phycisphaerae bacterium]|nr:phosphate ABC transporter ATP-binding protein [Phycisphaerae bacterium]